MTEPSTGGVAQLRRFGPVVILTLASQVASAASSAVLPVLGLSVADLYSAASPIGFMGFAGIAIGVVYNLAIGRAYFRHWPQWGAAAVLLTCTMGFATYMLLSAHGLFDRVPESTGTTVIALFTVGGAALGIAGVAAVRLACLGRPLPLAGVTVAPNILMLATTAIVAVLDSDQSKIAKSAPAAAFAIAALIVAVVVVFKSSRERFDSDIRRPPRTDLAFAGSMLVLGLVSSTVMPAVYAAAITSLAAGTLYAAALSAKIVNSAISLGVNSILLVKYNWQSHDNYPARLPPLFAVVSILSTALSVPLHLIDLNLVATALVVLSWAAILVAAAVVSREVNARRLTSTLAYKVILDVSLAIGAAVALTARPSLPGYFGAFMLSAAVTVFIGSWGLGQVRTRFLGLTSALLAGGLIIFGWR